MVFVMFPQSGQYAKINGCLFFQHPFRKHRYPPKKEQKKKETTINTQVNT